jgi:ceramide glucosyltransferase
VNTGTDIAIDLALLLAIASLIGSVYQIAAALLVRRFMKTPPEPEVAAWPGVTILKPLHGAEEGLAQNLRLLCGLHYPKLQILCNTLDPADPAQPIAQAVRAAYPKVDMEVLAGRGSDALNRKIASLEYMLPHAKHEVLVLADADVQAAPAYVHDLVAALERRGVGLVTCLYLARPSDSRWSRLESLWVNTAFLPSVLVARALGRRDGCFGATIALTRRTLDQCGGFAPLRDLLADDFALGAAVRRLRLKIALAARPVDMVVHHERFPDMFSHELRWARTIAALDRLGFMASILTQPVILGLLGMLLGGFAWPMTVVFEIAAIIRLMAIRIEERALQLPAASIGLLVIREFLTFAVFTVALFGRTVLWRGLRYRIRHDGTLQPLDPAHPVKEPAQ